MTIYFATSSLPPRAAHIAISDVIDCLPLDAKSVREEHYIGNEKQIFDFAVSLAKSNERKGYVYSIQIGGHEYFTSTKEGPN